MYTKETDAIVELAAAGFDRGNVTFKELDAMTAVIEMIVLPDDVEIYDAPILAKHIRKHIRKVGNIDKSMARKNELHKLYMASRSRKNGKILTDATIGMTDSERDSYVAFAKMTVAMERVRETVSSGQAIALASILLSEDASNLLKAAKAVVELKWDEE